jgi:hypothetical protein
MPVAHALERVHMFDLSRQKLKMNNFTDSHNQIVYPIAKTVT